MSLIEKALRKYQKEKNGASEKLVSSFSPHNLLNFPSRKKIIGYWVGILAVLIIVILGGAYLFSLKAKGLPSSAPQVIAVNKKRALSPSLTVPKTENLAAEINRSVPDKIAPSTPYSAPTRTLPVAPEETNNKSASSLPSPSLNEKKAPPLTKVQVKPVNKSHPLTPASEKVINFDSLLKKALIYDQAKNFLAALECYNQILAANPYFFDALINRGIILQKMGNSEGAKQDLLRAYELNPYDPVLLNALGVLYLKTGEETKAEELLLRADTTPSLINLALYYWQKGKDKEKVVSLLKQAEKQDSNDPYPVYYLGLFYRQIGENTLSREKLNQALSLAQKRGLFDLVQDIDSVMPGS